jgi:putative ABC transport system substrate-binding protein
MLMSIWNKLFYGMSILVLTHMTYGEATTLPQEPRKVVMITQIVEHPALTAVRKGVIDALIKQGYDPASTLELHYENAQGNITTAGQISHKFVGSNPDVVVAISTPSAQSIVTAARGQFPVVFAAVTDPLSAKLVKSMDKPGVPVTGVVDRAPFEEQLALIKDILGNKKRLGILYNAGEVNSVAAVDIIKAEASKLGLEIEGNAPKSSEVGTIAQGLTSKVDALFIPNDNTAVSSLDAIVKACEEARIPLFTADIMLVERGGVATIGYDYGQMGTQAGEMVLKILNGAKASEMAVEIPKEKALCINKTAADKIGLTLSADLLKRADKVF